MAVSVLCAEMYHLQQVGIDTNAHALDILEILI